MRFSLILLLIVFSFSVYAQGPLQDPIIPDGEKITYRTTGDDGIEFHWDLVRREARDGESFYRVYSESNDEDLELLINRDGLIPIWGQTISKGTGAHFRNEVELLSVPSLSNDAIFMTSIQDLTYLLRGYPFRSPRDLQVAMSMGNEDSEDSPFQLMVEYKKRETIRIDDESFRTYKLELAATLSGPMALFASFFPKTYLWYNVDSPHQLLKYQGSQGGPGDEVTVEMISYEVGVN